MAPEPEPPSLLDMYRLHSEEVRFLVQLNWDRAKSSLAFHVALLALIAALEKASEKGLLTLVLLGYVVISALLSAWLLHVGHGYYRAARDRRAEVEAKLGTEFGFVTTPGMRKAKRSWLPNVTKVLIVQHFLIATMAAGALIYFLKK